jgi:hypothetical protein
MNNKYIITSLFLLLSLSLNLYPQSGWYQPQRLTSGFVDRNPNFRSINNMGYGLSYFSTYEYFVFERYSSLYSQICLGKIGYNGLVDSILYLTSGSGTKKNSCISYGNGYSGTEINSSFVLWETNQNGKSDIYAKYYNKQSGWGSVFGFDTSSVNKYTPQCICIDSSKYIVAYEKSGDIIFRMYNPITQTISYDTNLTVSDTSYCFNPHIDTYNYYSSTSYYIITYEKKKADNKRAIYFRKSTGLTSWSSPDTIAYSGNNYFNSCAFVSNASFSFGVIFTSDRSGNKDIYLTSVPTSSATISQEKVFTNTGFNLYNFTSVYYPIITDAIALHADALLKRVNDSVKVMFDCGNYYSLRNDSTTVCDTSKNVSISLCSGVYGGYDLWVWVIYNKDSANVSQLWGRRKIIILEDIKKIGNTVPDKFSLSQNYPNPFNPVTNIKFQISSSKLVTIKVFDVLGKEVVTLVNQKLQGGEYEVTFDGNKLNSGVYFYRLQAGDYTETRKMTLVK